MSPLQYLISLMMLSVVSVIITLRALVIHLNLSDVFLLCAKFLTSVTSPGQKILTLTTCMKKDFFLADLNG